VVPYNEMFKKLFSAFLLNLLYSVGDIRLYYKFPLSAHC